MDLYYFSGTGNSLHVAREIQKRFPGARLLPIAGLLRKRNTAAASDMVGFVFPIHLTSLPYPVKDFITGLDLGAAEYIFAAATRAGTFHLADIQLDRLLRKKGKALDAFFILNMARNSPCGLVPKQFPGFKKMTAGWVEELAEDRLRMLEPEVEDKLENIRATVQGRGKHRDRKSTPGSIGRKVISLLMAPMEKSSRRQSIPFYADSDCTACGICEQVCPSGKIELAGNAPLWKPEAPCYFCYACFNCCPEQAILVKDRYLEKKGRYLYPGITNADIAGQK
jgi:ferredoxin/flavodoxin